jgi:hypothetical protein
VEGRPALHLDRRALAVREHEDRPVVRRVVAPPARPVQVPLAAIGAEHVAAHDERARVDDGIHLGLVLLGRVEHPAVQQVLSAVVPAGVPSDRILEALVGAGDEAVDRDGEVTLDDSHGVQCAACGRRQAAASRSASRIV